MAAVEIELSQSSLEAIRGLECEVCYVNEGHAAFAMVERARRKNSANYWKRSTASPWRSICAIPWNKSGVMGQTWKVSPRKALKDYARLPSKSRHARLALGCADLGPDQAAVFVIIHTVGDAAAVGIVLDHRQDAVAVDLDALRLAIEVIVARDLGQLALVKLLDQVGATVKVTILFDLGQLAIVVGFDDVGLAVAVGVEGLLDFEIIDPIDPFVRMTVMVTVIGGGRNRLMSATRHDDA